MKTAIYTHGSGLRHDTGPGHPEQIARLATLQQLFREPPFSSIPVIEAPEASRAMIARAHPRDYIDMIEESIPDRGHGFLDNDTVVCPDSYEAALRGAGGVCQAVDDVIAGTVQRAFCAMRPPGHHAEPSRANGFCLFNNIFIGALHAREQHGLERVAIVDFDVHHGNGTDAMARLHDGIFFASSHQWPLFPGTGGGDDDIPGRVLNIPVPAGTDGPQLLEHYTRRVLPALDAFRPQLLMISAGFDAHREDPLAGLALDDEDFFAITELLCRAAAPHTGGRTISVLEGGYNLDALKRSAAAHLRALAGL